MFRFNLFGDSLNSFPLKLGSKKLRHQLRLSIHGWLPSLLLVCSSEICPVNPGDKETKAEISSVSPGGLLFGEEKSLVFKEKIKNTKTKTRSIQ